MGADPQRLELEFVFQGEAGQPGSVVSDFEMSEPFECGL